MRQPRRGTLVWLTLFLAACSSNTGPTAGALNVDFSAQHPDDGAVLLIVSGGQVDSVESVGYPTYSARLGGDTLKIIVTGSLATGTIARLHIPDGRQAASYTARISQVAARVSYAQYDPAGYAVVLKP